MKKTVQVLMLPTNTSNYSKGDIVKGINVLMIAEYNNQYQHSGQHLYFISNEVVKVGDWCIGHHLTFNTKPFVSVSNGLPNSISKVIATTDKSLNLPLIPQSFIEEYVSKNGTINQVEVYTTLIGDEVATYSNIVQMVPAIKVEPKKQTVEEAALNTYPMNQGNYEVSARGISQLQQEAFIKGAKWQQSNS